MSSGPKKKKKLETKSELTHKRIKHLFDEMDKIFVRTGTRDKNYRQQKQLESKTASDQHRKRRSNKEIMESINEKFDEIDKIFVSTGIRDKKVQKNPQANTKGGVQFKKGGLAKRGYGKART